MPARINTGSIQASEQFPIGQAYRAALGIAGRTADEVRILLELLQRALADPIDIELHWHERTNHAPLLNGGEIIAPRTQAGSSTLTLFTSGTTGTPKRVCRSLEGEAEKRRGRGTPDDVWLLTYAPFRWAGISVLLHALVNRCAVVIPDGNEPALLGCAMLEGQVSHISLTPSLLRKLLTYGLEETLAKVPLRQITFGGEAADQQILATTRRLWPQARITQVYAMTELGDILAVSDGSPGIPASQIENNPRFIITSAGELIVDGYATSDLWERRDERYLYLGRKEEMINVGGALISPNEIEVKALAFEGVAWARAFAVPSPIIGSTVGLHYVGSAVPASLRSALRNQLPKVAWPSVIEKVDELVMTDAMKTSRRG